MEKNGSPTGDSCGWPALPLDLLTECDRCIHSVTLWPMKVRWSRDEVRAEYRRLTKGLDQKWPAARRWRDRLSRAVAARLRAQKRDEVEADYHAGAAMRALWILFEILRRKSWICLRRRILSRPLCWSTCTTSAAPARTLDYTRARAHTRARDGIANNPPKKRRSFQLPALVIDT